MNFLSILFMYALGVFYHSKRVMFYLQILQQEDYDTSRFFDWCKKNKAIDVRGLIGFIFLLFINKILGGLLVLGIIYFFQDPCKDAKLPLKKTKRAMRIYYTYLGLMGALNLIFCCNSIFLLFLVLSSPLILMASVKFLESEELNRQAQYVENAKNIYDSINPFTIGITGSFGKTSVKHILGPICQVTLGNTLWTKGGVNTIMGITQEIQDRFFYGLSYSVMEMGAYKRGSIAKVCELVKPKAAIITAVGECHLERFKTQETILKAKSELAISLPDEGILVVNGDNQGARKIGEMYPKNTTLFYGLSKSEDKKLDAYYKEYSYDKYGMKFIISFKGADYPGYTKMLGNASLSNILAAFTMSCALGADPSYVLATICHLEPFNNRLQLEITSDVVFLHDAYNSNPQGFESALDVLKNLELTNPSGRRILMTPGMIELGEKQFEHNKSIAIMASKICDVVIFVGNTNKNAWMEGLQGNKKNINVLYFQNRDEAFKEFHQMRKNGDILLIENDLTDIYETPWRF